MKHIIALFFGAVALFFLAVFWTIEFAPEAFESTGDEIVALGGYLNGDTFIVSEGETTLTIIHYSAEGEEVFIEVRLNNVMHQLEKRELPTGVPGRLYSVQLNVSPSDTLTTNSDVELYAEGSFKAQIHPINMVNRVVGSTLIVIAYCLVVFFIYYVFR